MNKETTLESKFQNDLLNSCYLILNSFGKSLIKTSKYILKNSWKFLPIGLERYYFMTGKRQKSQPTEYSSSENLSQQTY